MSPAKKAVPRLPRGVAGPHDVISVVGARVNNLKDVSVEVAKRQLTVFTGVSGSGKSSLVFDTIAAESQRLINETYSSFVQGFMPTLARPEVDVLTGLTTAIIVSQDRLGGDGRLEATLAHTAREGAECLQGGQRRRAVLQRGEMDERVVRQPEHRVVQSRRRLLLQLAEHRRAQALVLLGLVGSGFVANQCPLHGFSSIVGLLP